MKRIYLLAYITILCCLCPLLKAQLGPMPFTPVPVSYTHLTLPTKA